MMYNQKLPKIMATAAAVMLLVLCIAAVPVAAGAPSYVEVSTWDDLVTKVSEWTDQNTTRTVVVTQSVTKSPSDENYGGILVKGKITVKPAASSDVVINANQNGRIFNVNSSSLTLVGNGTAKLTLTGGNNSYYYGGGAVYLDSGASLTLSTGAEITNSTAENGGGVYVSPRSNFILDGGSIRGCHPNGEWGTGGGVYVDSFGYGYDGGTFTMLNGSITDCRAGSAGGVFVGWDSTFAMFNGEISNCEAMVSGGVRVQGIFNMTGGSISDCRAEYNGGGMNVSGTVILSGGSITNCSAPVGSGIDIPWGTLFVSGNAVIDEISDVRLGWSNISSTSPFTGKIANISLSGDPYYMRGNTIVMNGAADKANFTLSKSLTEQGYLLAVNGPNLVLTKDLNPYVEVSTWDELENAVSEWDNKVSARTIVVKSNITSTYSWTGYSGIPVSGNIIIKPAADKNVTINALQKGRFFNIAGDGANLTLAGNGTATLTLTGGSYSESSGNGGSILIDDNANLALSTGAKIQNSYAKNGSCVYVNSGTFTLCGGSISNCYAANLGGAVYISGLAGSDGQFILKEGSISNCRANKLGGAVYNNHGTFKLTNGSIANCTAGDFGGAVCSCGDFTMTDGRIVNCSTTNDGSCGGGIYVDEGGAVSMTGGSIIDCHAGYGGGIYLINSGSLTMHGGYIVNCSTGNFGGGIFAKGHASVTLNNGNITKCHAYDGAGVFVEDCGSFTMKGGNITHCSASNNGGGVCVRDNGAFTMIDGHITHNFADYCGGGVFNDNGSFTMTGGSITHCSAADGGGAYLSTFNVKGTSVITNNTESGCIGNIWLSSNNALTLVGDLTGKLGISYAGSEPSARALFGTADGLYTGAEHIFADPLSTLSGKRVGTSLVWSTIEPHTITITHTIGGNASASASVAEAGAVVTLTATADEGYIFKEWQVVEGGATVRNNTFTMPKNDVIINAVFETNALRLLPGWNFISVPKKLSAQYDTAAELFAGVNTSGKAILSYNTQNKSWDQVKADTVITPLTAYWIYSTSAKTITPTFDVGAHAPASKNVYVGWNAVGLSAEEPMTAAAVFNNLNWRTYLAWDAAEHKYDTAIIKGGTGKYSDENSINLWRGGWVYMDADGTYIGYA